MSVRLFNVEATHWYTFGGQAVHTVRGANGQERATTLADARRLMLVPSVTNVLSVIAKPSLVAWQLESAVIAALTLPRRDGETIDELAKRAAEDSQEVKHAAAEFGTRLHAGAERLGQDLWSPIVDEVVGPWLELYRQWLIEEVGSVEAVERVVVNARKGYAGTMDLVVRHKRHGRCLVDIKTQRVRPGARVKYYQTWIYQLGAYWKAIGEDPGTKVMNLVFESGRAVAPVEHVYGESELKEGVRGFEAALALWRLEKGYVPARTKRELKEAGARMSGVRAAAEVVG